MTSGARRSDPSVTSAEGTLGGAPVVLAVAQQREAAPPVLRPKPDVLAENAEEGDGLGRPLDQELDGAFRARSCRGRCRHDLEALARPAGNGRASGGQHHVGSE